MIRYYTAEEISIIWRKPIGTIWRLASQHHWPRSTDNRRPVLYRADDVDATMAAFVQAREIIARRLDPKKADTADRR